MSIYFKNGFFDSRVHSSIPSDAVEISEVKYKELLEGQSTGLRITTGAGGVPELTGPSNAELLALAKSIKNSEADQEYIAACAVPVLTNGILMKGGEGSASTIKGALDRMIYKQKRDPKKNTVRLFDVYGQVHTVSFEAAEIIAEEIADVVEEALFTLVQKKRAIAMATTIEELN